jgi:hypothetical protein
MNLGMLLDRAMIDPLAFVERILQQALDQLAREGALAGDGDRPPEELIATALGNRLAHLIASENSSRGAGWASEGQGGDELVVYEDLIARNGALAAAVGACDCWGEQVGCRLCAGAGTPGWVLPDAELFATYVYPAMRAVSRRRASKIGALDRTENQRKEIGHAEHWVR